jgi:hypothetical protein
VQRSSDRNRFLALFVEKPSAESVEFFLPRHKMLRQILTMNGTRGCWHRVLRSLTNFLHSGAGAVFIEVARVIKWTLRIQHGGLA